ncbi:MAG: class I SAM-dependent methyltransferase [Xanthomonadales bacterium]|nr:class I SAM-dependent methyltransferase [Gammaproteobacteria bacterium]NNK04016.1 class I SAM-dependent methyltransferase [Xanthomonadales bacterium]
MTNPTRAPSCCCCFELQHEQHSHPAMRAVERDVLGCDFGGTSWTTKAQADRVQQSLGLAAGTRLLELGAGTGWPGIYLAGLAGCDVTMLDLPVNSLIRAQRRASEENVSNRCRSVAASAAALPFRSRSFDAITHSDVLCCLPEKLAMLRECRRVTNKGANMLFYVIAPEDGLTSRELTRASDVGPPFVEVPGDYASLLLDSAWKLIRKTDLTADYLLALHRLVGAFESESTALEALLGSAEYTAQLLHRQQQVDAIERGLLVREMYVATAT